MMKSPGSWAEKRLAAAVAVATTEKHKFPDAINAKLLMLLMEDFQEARKITEIDDIAAALISTNRGAQ